jgi:hypothetical protein
MRKIHKSGCRQGRIFHPLWIGEIQPQLVVRMRDPMLGP